MKRPQHEFLNDNPQPIGIRDYRNPNGLRLGVAVREFSLHGRVLIVTVLFADLTNIK